MGSRRLHAALIAIAALVISFLPAAPAAAQVLVLAERDLQFGSIMPGVQMTVAPTDLRSAQVRVQAGRGRYQISFMLPDALMSPEGRTVPLLWGPTDGRIQIRNNVSTFDPREALNFRLNPVDEEALLNLGARAQPLPGQAAGMYSATIVLMIVQTGN
jgi:hypothetical protein